MADNKNKKVLNVPAKREQNDACICSAEREEQITKAQPKGNVPALRFPEFTEGWATKSISDLATVTGGGTPDTAVKSYWNGDIQWFTPSEIGKNKYVDLSLRTITEEGLNNSSAKLLPPYTILLSSRATVGECSIALQECATNQGFQSLIAKNCDIDFLYYLIQTKKKELMKKACGSTFLEISANEIRKIHTYVPSINEQKKIGVLLSLIDKCIDTQNKIIEDLKKLKSAIYQKMFESLVAPTLKLGQIVEIIKGQQVNGTDLLEQGDYYVMNGGAAPSGWLNRYNTEANTISISEGGNSCGYVQYNTSRYWSGGHCYSLRILHPQETLDLYLYHFLKWQEENIMALRIGSGLPNIQKKDLLRFPVILPTIPQQNKIVSILSAIEEKVSCEISITQYFVKQKEYLLSQLFI